jgi:serine/threonine protein phosphatase PrpC
MNHGRIYLHKTDVEHSSGALGLRSGARVSFVLYADEKGIGAAEARLEDAHAVKGGNAKGGRKGWGGVQQTIVKVVDSPAPASKGCGKGKSTPKGKDKDKPAAKGKAMSPMLMSALGIGPRREKKTEKGSDTVIHWASSEMQGWRPAMEDATLVRFDLAEPLSNVAMFAVFDGHGGAEVSKRAAAEFPDVVVQCAAEVMAEGAADDLLERALQRAMPTLDARLREDGARVGEDQSGIQRPAGITCEVNNAFALMGSTAVVALLQLDAERRPWRVVVANCGDSRATLCRQGTAVPLSEDQKPEMPVETARIEAAGGHVAKVGPCFRVDGWGLNLSRALGDFHYKAREDLPPEAQKVSCCPEVMSVDITPEDEFMLLGCDGVYELHTWQTAIDLARSGLEEQKVPAQVVEELCDASCSENLMKTQGQGGDNVSALLVMLR